jgi:hypothetical protein
MPRPVSLIFGLGEIYASDRIIVPKGKYVMLSSRLFPPYLTLFPHYLPLYTAFESCADLSFSID